jgi:hypothetical protein
VETDQPHLVSLNNRFSLTEQATRITDSKLLKTPMLKLRKFRCPLFRIKDQNKLFLQFQLDPFRIKMADLALREHQLGNKS